MKFKLGLKLTLGIFTPVVFMVIISLIASGNPEKSQPILLAGNIITLMIAAVTTFWLIQNIARPIAIMENSFRKLAVGDLNNYLPMSYIRNILSRKDEIGDMGKSFAATENYMDHFAKNARLLADGDLSLQIRPYDPEDRLGHAFVDMINNLRILVEQVHKNGQQLSRSANELSAISAQAGQATNQIAASIQQVAGGSHSSNQSASFEQLIKTIDHIASGAQNQEKAIEEVASATTQISGAIQKVDTNIQEVNNHLSKTAEVAKAGVHVVGETLQGMNNIQTKVGLTSQKVKEMGERSNQIGSIVQTINDIASQTNLLALNAAIEAARAGEQGKGFAVVAEEVRKLAELSKAATQEISDLVVTIQHTISDAVTAMRESTDEVEKGVQYAQQAGKALNNILDGIEDVYQQVQYTNLTAQSMTEVSNTLVSAMDSVAAVIQQNTVVTREMSSNSSEVARNIDLISATSEEMSAQVQEVSASAHSLSEMAQELQKAISKFKLNNSFLPQ